jgi:hypothetical protein
LFVTILAARTPLHSLTPFQQPDYDDKETKRILRKVDWRLIPLLSTLYLLAFIDRGNLGNAKVAGMNADLGLTGAQYNMALTVFFFPYAIFEVRRRDTYWIASSA